jgi:NDP-sugar pyrophosphorylase family protein
VSSSGLAGVVLAAGLGTRLRPLTELRPKALCPVGGMPLVDHALARVTPYTGAGRDHLAVNAHHHAAQLAEHLAERVHLSVEQPEELGTAGALGALRGWIDGRDVLVTNADAWLRGELGLFVDGWDRSGCRLLGVEVGRRADFGTMRYVGACLLPWSMVRRLSDEPSGLYEVMWRRAERESRLEVVAFEGTSIDCGTPADYLAANLDAAGGGSLVHPDAVVPGSVERSVVGQGAVVEGRVDRCVVWDGAWVEAGEHLVEVIRAGTRAAPVTVPAAADTGRGG